MIFGLQYALVFAGYGAVSNLSGQYMKHYTGATDFDLGLYFMIPPLLVLVRPLICAQADRHSSHKRLFIYCLFGSALSYLPYVVLPFVLEACPDFSRRLLSKQTRLWLLTAAHLAGSVFFNGVRALADATAMNHAKRTDCDYVSFRKWAPVGFGVCGFLFGLINQDNGLLPDFVPGMLLFCGCMLTLGLLVHLWPDEYFVMAAESTELAYKARQRAQSLPAGPQTLAIMRLKLAQTFAFWKPVAPVDSKQANVGPLTQVQTNTNQQATTHNHLSVRQQLSILALIIRRDFRIPLGILVLLVGGWICRSAQNFVFMHADGACLRAGACDPSALAGLMIAGFSLLEFLTYVLLEVRSRARCAGPINRLSLIQAAVLSIAVHYFALAYLADRVSPHFFLAESLHGLEFALLISTCLDWGFTFASGVELLIPELLERRIVGAHDDMALVRVSLVATMMSCMTLAFDGLGSMIGSLFYGWLIELRGYAFAWLVNGSLAAATFVLILAAVLLGKLFRLRPQIVRLRDEALKASCC